jgi:hypothetical protein
LIPVDPMYSIVMLNIVIGCEEYIINEVRKYVVFVTPFVLFKVLTFRMHEVVLIYEDKTN